jgi:hypothetical protein
MTIANFPGIRACRPAWNKGRVVGQKRPLMPKHVWAIRVRLEIAENDRGLALFNFAIDSKLRGCDLVKLKVTHVYASGQVKERASVIQSKTRRPVRFEITGRTRKSLARWRDETLMIGSEFLWPSRFHERLQISTRQYARLVRDWVNSNWIGCHVLRHALDAPDQGCTDLQEDWEPAFRAAPARSHQDGQHRPISRV